MSALYSCFEMHLHCMSQIIQKGLNYIQYNYYRCSHSGHLTLVVSGHKICVLHPLLTLRLQVGCTKKCLNHYCFNFQATKLCAMYVPESIAEMSKTLIKFCSVSNINKPLNSVAIQVTAK